MIAFEVFINGEKICKAGIRQKYGILSSIISWSNRDISSLPPEAKNQVPSEELKITIGGQERINTDDYENVQWGGRSLKVGDEVKVIIVDSTDCDEPKYRKAREKQSK